MIILRQRAFSGIGTRIIYKTKSGFNKVLPKVVRKSDAELMRGTIREKTVLEKAGHIIADRYPITAGLSSPLVPLGPLSWAGGAVYMVSPNTLKKIPVFSKYLPRLENSKAVETLGKPIHEFTDYLFKAGKHKKPVKVKSKTRNRQIPNLVPVPARVQV